jgi:hypothetical protein
MPDSITLAPSGLQVSPGDHVCAFYPGLSDRDEILIPYLSEGLHDDHKCVCIVDATDPKVLLDSLGAEVDVPSAVGNGQLVMHSSRSAYLKGAFVAEKMMEFWGHSKAEIQGGFGFIRVVGEMTWALHQWPGIEELSRFEARLNQVLPGHPQVSLCLYELDRFSGEILVDALKTHPKMLIGGMVIENPYYLEPDEFLALKQ